MVGLGSLSESDLMENATEPETPGIQMCCEGHLPVHHPARHQPSPPPGSSLRCAQRAQRGQELRGTNPGAVGFNFRGYCSLDLTTEWLGVCPAPSTTSSACSVAGVARGTVDSEE